MNKHIIYLIIITLFISGCSIGEIVYSDDEWALKNAGINADPFYIEQMKKENKLEAIAYPESIYDNGRFYMRNNYEDIKEKEKEIIEENEKLIERYSK